MATLPGLVAALAETDGREQKSIEHIARFIRERGYIQNGKRGAGAPQMNSTDAANLLIALCGCDTPGEAPLAIDRFRSLRPMYEGDAGMIRRYVESIDHMPDTIREMMNCQTFGTALETMIDGAASLLVSLYEKGAAYRGDDNEKAIALLIKANIVGVEVELLRYAAEVRLFHMEGANKVADFEAKYIVDLQRSPGFYGMDAESADRRVKVVFGIKTLLQAYRATNVDEEAKG